MNYETWVGLAFLLWCVSVVTFFININSQYERNLNKVGLRLSWMTFTPKEMSEADTTRGFVGKAFRFALVFGFGLVSIFLGPIYVVLAVIIYVSAKVKDSGAPASVKEYRWRLRNQNLSAEEITTLSQQQTNFLGMNGKTNGPAD